MKSIFKIAMVFTLLIQAFDAKSQVLEDIFNTWQKNTCRVSYRISAVDIRKAGFKSLKYYKTPASLALKKKLKSSFGGMGNVETDKTVSLGSITFSCTESGEEEGGGSLANYYFLEDKVYFYGYYGGSSGESFMYDMKTLKLVSLNYQIMKVTNLIADVEKNYLDPRGSDHPDYQGRIFLTGKLNLRTNVFTWEK